MAVQDVVKGAVRHTVVQRRGTTCDSEGNKIESLTQLRIQGKVHVYIGTCSVGETILTLMNHF